MLWSPRVIFGRTSGRNWSHALPQHLGSMRLGLSEGNFENPIHLLLFLSSIGRRPCLGYHPLSRMPSCPFLKTWQVGDLDGPRHFGEILKLREPFLLTAVINSVAGARVLAMWDRTQGRTGLGQGEFHRTTQIIENPVRSQRY